MHILYKKLLEEKQHGYKGGIYHLTQIKFAYNSNHMEGSQLSEDQTRYIFETNTVLPDGKQGIRVDDITEAMNHFALFDYMLESAKSPITDNLIKDFHRILKRGTSDEGLSWFRVGDYKQMPNQVGLIETADPEAVPSEMEKLLREYHSLPQKKLEDILAFHVRFERIHPFQDGNGRVGRMIMFRECMNSGIVPFIITDETKAFYYRGLTEYSQERGYLLDTCLAAQDQYKTYLQYFKISKEDRER